MINLKMVRAMGNKPRVHGNGFVQLDLTKTARLHIWGDPRIPKQAVATPIHDHVFGFESTIIVGRVISLTYHVTPREHGDFRVYVPEIREGEDTILMPTDVTVNIEPARVATTNWNTALQKYTFSIFEFHEMLIPEPSATIMVKDGPTLAQGAMTSPRVLCPVDKVPDNVFNRYDADEDLLWRIIEDTLKRRSQ